MRKRTLGVALLAGLAISGGSAFTAANSLPASTVAGYGAAAVTGATVTDIQYNVGADASLLSSIVFTATEDLDLQEATLSLRTAGGVQVGASITCDTPVFTTVSTITCTTTAPVASFASVGLTVRDA